MNENKYYGLYEGICVRNDDPDNGNKITLLVPQILGDKETNWAKPCTPVIANANHPDHVAHTAAQVAALLTTTSASASDPQGGSVTIPALTVVAKSGAGTLTHPHATSLDPLDTTTASPEHTYHRAVPNVSQKVWVMFIGGDANFPVWLGVEL